MITFQVNHAVRSLRSIESPHLISTSRSRGSLTYALVVDDLDDGSQAASVLALLDQDNTTNLDGAPLGSNNADVTHFVGGLS